MDNNNFSHICVFEEFQRNTCSELFKRYNALVENAAADDRKSPEYIRACFMLSYCCILLKDVANAGNWRLRFQKAIGVPDAEDRKCRTLSNKEAFSEIAGLREEDADFKQYAVMDMFLEVHISWLSLDLSSSYHTTEFGIVKSKEIGCTPFCLFFLVLFGWLNRYLQKNAAADTYFSHAEACLREHPELKDCNSFFADMVSAGKHGDTFAETDTLNGWAKYYYNEFSQLARLVNCGSEKFSEQTSRLGFIFTPQFYNDLFGEMTCSSNFDRVLSQLASGNFDNVWENYKQELSYNQRLYCEKAMNRPISLDGINEDSFIIAPSELSEDYSLCVRQNALSNANIILNVYDSYLRNSKFQINLSATMPLLKVWLEKRKGTVNELVSLVSVTGLSGPTDRPIAEECCIWCTNNLKLICSLQACVSDLERLDLAVCVYKLSPILFPDKSDEYNTYVRSVVSPLNDLILRLNNSTEINGQSHLSGIISYYGEHLGKTYPALLDNEIIRSVIVVQNIENTENIKRLMNYFGERYNDLERLERTYLETLIGSVFNENTSDLDSSSVESSGLYMKVRVNKVDFFNIYIFSNKGEWEIVDDQQWRSGTSKITSPLRSVLDSKACKQGIPIIFLLMSGTKIDEKEFYKEIGDNNIRLYTIAQLRSKLTTDTSHKNFDAEHPHNFLDAIFNGRPETESIDDTKADISDRKNRSNWDFVDLIKNIRKDSFTETPNVYTFEGRIPEAIESFWLTQMLFDYAKQISDKATDFEIVYTAQFVQVEYAFLITIVSNAGNIGLNSFTFYSKHPFDEDGTYLSNTPSDNVLKHRICVKAEPKIEDTDSIFCSILASYQEILQSCQDVVFLEYYIKSRILEVAVKNARIAIMSRNVSHNLGSHVMAYLKHHLGSLQEMLRNQVFDQLFRNEEEFRKFLDKPAELIAEKGLKNKSDQKSVALPFLIGLGKFISYIQERQDFIACVATDFAPSCSALNFKDYIYDELNIDKRSLRHPERMGEVPDNILLGNIARSEGLQRKHYLDSGGDDERQNDKDIVLKFRTFDGDKTIEHSSQEQDLNEMRKYALSIPGGVTGRHAFFTIVENIIRNAAKHGNRNGEKSLEISFDFFDTSDFERSCDNDACDGEYTLREVFSKYYVTADDAANLYFITITDNFKTEYEDLRRIREALAEEYVDDNGAFNEHSKGLKEMRICAAWLRGQYKEFYICSKDDVCKHDKEWDVPKLLATVPTLYARLSNGHLQFIFAVKKPMEVLLLTNSFSAGKYDKMKAALSRHRWQLMSPDGFLSGQPMPNYDFIIFMDDDKVIYDRLRWQYCNRMFWLPEVPELCDLKEYLSRFQDKEDQINAKRLRVYKEKILWKFSGYEVGDKITISDAKTVANIKKQPAEDQHKLSQYIDVGDGIELGDYSYMKHYESCFENIKEAGDTYRFIEGISGANSTDRLVRYEPINIEWFCKHLHAMKQRIAVFDERLANKILAGHEGVLFADKGVWIFNMVQSDSKRQFSIYGVSPDKELSLDNKRTTVVTMIASLTFNENIFDIILEDKCGKFRNYFDKITIHQGLLDKIYSMCGIKSDSAAKERVTKTLYKVFHKNGNDEILEKNGHFLLPGMCIHSGRSKPIENDMPQMLPFIQYASLEHAVFDCKYALTELLETIKI